MIRPIACNSVILLLAGMAAACAPSTASSGVDAATGDEGATSPVDAAVGPSSPPLHPSTDASSPTPPRTPDAGDGGEHPVSDASEMDAANVADAAGGLDGGGTKVADGGAGDSPILSGNQVLVWMPTYLGSFSANLNAVTGSSPKAFTQVSPDFYNLNYDYASGPAQISGETFDGLSVAQVSTQVHNAGMLLIPLVYAGAGNSGTDQGIQNVISDSPSGAQANFISAMVAEAKTRGYDGWNLDFEVGSTGYTQYGAPYVSFLTAFKAALHAERMILTIDIGDWYVRQCGSDGLVNLTSIGASVDSVIIEDYSGTFGSPLSSCPAGAPPAQQNCANEFGALMNIMCDVVPTNSVSIGLIQGSGGSGTNPFLNQAVPAVAALGFTSIAVWPDDTPFLDATNIPNGGTWYSLLASFLAK